MKKVLCMMLALIMALSLAACGQNNTGNTGNAGNSGNSGDSGDSGETSGTIKIGYFSDMSSADGYIGTAGYYALLDRAEELNANGGLLGKQIEIIAYDNAGKNEEVVNIVNKLCYADKVNVIIGPPPAPTPSLPPPLSTRRRSP